MVTRAVSLLIVIGDHEALEQDHNWAEFIDQCNAKGALLRDNKTLHPRIRPPK